MCSEESVLVIRHGALGDFCMTLGWMQAVRNLHPDAKLVLLTQGFLVSFSKCLGIFDEIITDDRKPWRTIDWLRICGREIANRQWSAIYDFQCNHRTLGVYRRIVTTISRYPIRWVSFKDGEFRVWETAGKRAFLPVFPQMRVIRFAYETKYDFSKMADRSRLTGKLPSRYAVVIPGCSPANPEKRWPAENYREITEWLSGKGLVSVVLGTRSEAKEIATICDRNVCAISFQDVCSIEDIPMLARGARIVIGNDTGPTHLCRLAGAFTVVLLPAKSAHLAVNTPRQRTILADRVDRITLEEVKRACEV